MPSTIVIGSRYEKQVEGIYQSLGYKTHRMVKSRFGKQDFLTIGDVMATKPTEFVIIACAVGRKQTGTVRKIEAMKPFIPPSIRIEYRVLNKDGTESISQY